MAAASIAGRDLVEGVTPFIASNDAAGLSRYLDEYWPRPTLVSLLMSPDRDVVKASIMCLERKHSALDSPQLARLLHHDDDDVVAMAEYALWSIWLRAGDAAANALLAQAIRAMNRQHYVKAAALLGEAIRQCPGFAEAYNQRAIAWYLQEKFAWSIADCRRALQLNPWHFGAAAGLGHCYAHLGLHEHSLEAYQTALNIHPRLDGVRQAIRHVRQMLAANA